MIGPQATYSTRRLSLSRNATLGRSSPSPPPQDNLSPSKPEMGAATFNRVKDRLDKQKAHGRFKFDDAGKLDPRLGDPGLVSKLEKKTPNSDEPG